MNVFIEKFKISNFLSFFGAYEINLKPFSAIMCNFYEGKDDLFRAFEFVFGAELGDLRIQNPLDLVHKVLREEFLVNRDIQTFVEVTLNLLQEKKQVKLSRSVKLGVNNVRIEHKISDLITTSVLYKEKLSSLGVYIKEQNLMFYKNYFDSAIWGSAEELEMVICSCLREDYLLEEWKTAKKEVEYLTKLKNRSAERNYNAMKKSHTVIEEYTGKYKTLCANRKAISSGRLFMDDTSDTSNGSTPSEIKSPMEETKDDFRKKEKISALEDKIIFLTEELEDLKSKEARLIGRLYHEESKSANTNILQNRIRHLKLKLQEKGTKISEITEEIRTVKSELDSLSQKISLTLISLQGYQITNYRQNRFTRYGRFYDFLQPSRYVGLLKQIIGTALFYSHLCDSVEEAFSIMKQLRILKHENREVFLPFENYSPKLKDVITASGELGVKINTLEEFLTFLCKLKHYDVIEEVPVIVQKHFDFNAVVPEGYTVFTEDNIYFTNDGLICCKVDESFTPETEKELQENLIQLCSEQELKYRKWDSLLHSKWETLVEIDALENDILYFRRSWRKCVQKSPVARDPSPLLEIYEEYSEIFRQHTEEREKFQLQEEEPTFEETDSSIYSSEDLSVIMRDLEDATTQKTNLKKELDDSMCELHLLNVVPIHGWDVQKNVIKFRCNNFEKSELFFEKQLKTLTNLFKEDDLEDFFGGQQWRKDFIASLIKDLDEIKKKLKTSTEALQNIATARKRKLYELVNHCGRFLSSTFSHIVYDALPFVKINFDSEEELHIMSSVGEEKINNVDIKNFNAFLKFISALSVFLEIAKFNKLPFMIMDDLEDYFPNYTDDLSAVLDSENLEKMLLTLENPRFFLLIRVGLFLKHYIKKNTPGRPIRNNGNQTDYTNGPIQIIYFAKEDLIHSAEHYIWIQNQVFKEYTAANCDSYSEIHEINFD